MPRHIVLLRGINLGSRRRVAMADLRVLLSRAGHGDVRTLLQSGNVVLNSEETAARLERLIETQILAALEMDVPVIVRSRDEIADVVRGNPLRDVADDFKRFQVSFLSSELPPDIARELNSVDVAPERLVASGRELYMWQPNGIQKSPLGKLLEARRLPVTATTRNWNTVTKLLELADS